MEPLNVQLLDLKNDSNLDTALNSSIANFEIGNEQLLKTELLMNECQPRITNGQVLQDHNASSSNSFQANLNMQNIQDRCYLSSENQINSLVQNNSYLVSINLQSLNNLYFQDFTTVNSENIHKSKESEFVSTLKDIAIEHDEDKHYYLDPKEFKETLFKENYNNISNFSYPENAEFNNNLLPISQFSNINRKIIMNNNSALTLVNYQGNLLAFCNNDSFLFQ